MYHLFLSRRMFVVPCISYQRKYFSVRKGGYSLFFDKNSRKTKLAKPREVFFKLSMYNKYYRNIRGVSNTRRKQSRFFFCVYDRYFYFLIIPTWRVILIMIAVFLFAIRFRRYPILRVKLTPYGITFFHTPSWWLQCCGQSCGLWLACCNLAVSVGIVPTINHDNLVTITLHYLFLCHGFLLMPRILW